MQNKKSFENLFFQSKFVFWKAAPSHSFAIKADGPSKTLDKTEKREFKAGIQKAKLELAKLARRGSFHDVQVKLHETTEDKYFYAATEWAVKSNSAFYSKRDKILRALTTNPSFAISTPAKVFLKKYDVFEPKNIKALLKKLSGRWILKGIIEIPRAKLPGMMKLMSPALKAQLKVIAQMKVKKTLRKAQNAKPSSVKAVNYTKSLNKYQKVLDALEGRIQGKPAAVKNAAVKTVPYKPPRTNKPTRTDTI